MKKILMVAPQPFLEERGAPFAVYHHIKALLKMGFEVDLVTYHLGKTVDLPGLHIYRIPDILHIKQVKVGPSLAKIPLDLLLALMTFWRLCCKRYSAIHTHEEAGLIGTIARFLFGCKHLYYMHSDLSQQIVSSDFTHNIWLIRIVEGLQRFLVRSADMIIAVCPDIEVAARRMAPQKPIYMIENSAIDEDLPGPSLAQVEQLRQRLHPDGGPVLLYTGTFEPYQGLDLLLASIPGVVRRRPDVRYVLVGGQPDQVEEMRQQAEILGVSKHVIFTGQRPLAEMPLYTALADILLSPRSKGTNTPLKLYTYLRSGKPLLATSIYSQTQVLSREIACLVPPDPRALTQGTLWLLQHPDQATAMSQRGQQYALTHYSWPVFLEKCAQVQREFTGIDIVLPSETFTNPQTVPQTTVYQQEGTTTCAV